MINLRNTIYFGLLAAFISSPSVFAGGYVSPKTIKMTIVSATVTTVGGTQNEVFATPTEQTFSSSATDFAVSKLGSISMPEGRYSSARVCYYRTRKIVIDGSKYYGD